MGGQFDHVPEALRVKIASDFLARLTPEGAWDYENFDQGNDYQRHLFALFLRLSGYGVDKVMTVVHTMAKDVLEARRLQYAYAVAHSAIVGFPVSQEERVPVPEVTA